MSGKIFAAFIAAVLCSGAGSTASDSMKTEISAAQEEMKKIMENVMTDMNNFETKFHEDISYIEHSTKIYLDEGKSSAEDAKSKISEARRKSTLKAVHKEKDAFKCIQLVQKESIEKLHESLDTLSTCISAVSKACSEEGANLTMQFHLVADTFPGFFAWFLKSVEDCEDKPCIDTIALQTKTSGSKFEKAISMFRNKQSDLRVRFNEDYVRCSRIAKEKNESAARNCERKMNGCF